MEDFAQTVDGLSASQRSQLHEVADLMLEIFHTLARMRYLPAEWIEEGPHDVSALLPTYHSLDLEPAIIYLYSILPYIKQSHIWKRDFFQGGEFADFRNVETVEQGRDPFWDESPAGRLRPWMTPLSMIGNHCDAIIYDARQHRIGIFGQMTCWSSTDRNVHEGWRMIREDDGDSGLSNETGHGDDASSEGDASDIQVAENGHGQVSDDEGLSENDTAMEDEEDGEDQGESDESEEEDEDEEEVDCDNMDARPAANVLRDIIRWYYDLSEVPGGGEHSGSLWNQETAKSLYQKHGWPGEGFDGDAFEADLLRAHVAENVRHNLKPGYYSRISCLEYSLKEEHGPALQKRTDKLATASSVDEEWVARWELWEAERRFHQAQAELRAAKEATFRAAWEPQTFDPEESLLKELVQLGEEITQRQEIFDALRKLLKWVIRTH
ncbi:hypothetical protein HIM_04102 [Hirsutella minnesotensis 3608]|uniref:Uncharacterized protein n=1 Tax=Hirsutella minnesotensis 3608 TaxID=1043627 RepID=A0A0F7ZVC5_9HYPO|nr:hypothetical protein HIM_04102 [Hirsutella minnesotensis 3608]